MSILKKTLMVLLGSNFSVVALADIPNPLLLGKGADVVSIEDLSKEVPSPFENEQLAQVKLDVIGIADGKAIIQVEKDGYKMTIVRGNRGHFRVFDKDFNVRISGDKIAIFYVYKDRGQWKSERVFVKNLGRIFVDSKEGKRKKTNVVEIGSVLLESGSSGGSGTGAPVSGGLSAGANGGSVNGAP